MVLGKRSKLPDRGNGRPDQPGSGEKDQVYHADGRGLIVGRITKLIQLVDATAKSGSDP